MIRRGIYLLPIAIFIALAIFFLFRLYAGDPSRIPSVLTGRPAPELTLPPLTLAHDAINTGLEGISPDIFKRNKITIVNVWASWCAPCREEHPYLMQLARRVRSDDALQIVGLNYKDKSENARRFLGALGNPFTVIGVDATGRAGIEWGVYGVPETFIVDRQGIIRHKHIGPLVGQGITDFENKITALKADIKM
jgi:cytochrome c biogenesis protein CcmG/thiol:disulfide interchange protein DsbE